MKKYLNSYGWNANWQKIWEDSASNAVFLPARIIADFGKRLQVVTQDGIISSDISGSLLHSTLPENLPKIGDWVAVEKTSSDCVVKLVLPRRSELVRGAAGKDNSKQVFACNVDVACVVQSADDDFNISRIRRYLFQLNKANVAVILVLNKIDTDNAWQKKLDQLHAEFPSQKVIAMRGTSQDSVVQLQALLEPGCTAVVVGSSGVGKSTIINSLLGFEKQATQTARADDAKGRHTTTHREMFLLQNGSLLIDTPGVRELQLWGKEEDIEFIDEHIASLQQLCKFTTCSHTVEPGCAVVKAIKAGELSEQSLVSYNKLKKELAYMQAKNADNAKHLQRQKQKKLRKSHEDADKQEYDQVE